MNVRKWIFVVVGTLWAVLFAAYYVFAGGQLSRSLGTISADAAVRAEIESGDAGFHKLLGRIRAAQPGDKMLIFGVDPTQQNLFMQYRACYELYPVRPWYVGAGGMPAGRKFTVALDEKLGSLVRDNAMTTAAVFERNAPDKSGIFRIRLLAGNRLEMTRLKEEASAPPAPPATSAPLWLLGVAVLFALGFAFSLLAGVDAALGRDLPARLGFAFFAGTGLTGWLMTVMGLVGIRHSVPAVLLAWLVPLAGAGIRHYLSRRGPGPAPAGEAKPAAPATPEQRAQRLFDVAKSSLKQGLVDDALDLVQQAEALAPNNQEYKGFHRQILTSYAKGGAAARPPEPAAPARAGLSAWDWTGIGLFAFTALWALVTIAVPMSAWSNWDTWAIWNFKAKACLLEGGIPFGMLGEELYRYSHPDYPLGLPMVQSFLARFAGGMDGRLLRALSPLYLLSLGAMLAYLLGQLGAAKYRWLLAGMFISLPKFAEQASNGYADLPLAAGMVACTVALALAWRGAPVGWLAGLMGGLAAVHKDEGLIWGASCILVLALWAWRGRGAWKQVVWACALLAVLVVPWKSVTSRMGLKPNDYEVNIPRLVGLAPSRVPLVATGVVLETLGPGVTIAGVLGQGKWTANEWFVHLRGTWLVLWYALGLAFLLGIRGWRAHALHRWLAISPLLQASAYTAVYCASIVQPLPFQGLAWHLTTSLDRLLLQLVPAVFAVLMGALFTAAPAPVAAKPAGGKGPGKVRA